MGKTHSSYVFVCLHVQVLMFFTGGIPPGVHRNTGEQQTGSLPAN